MKTTIMQMFHALEKDLAVIQEQEDGINAIMQSIIICRKHLQQLNEFISRYEFDNTVDEIAFFKETKPLFHKQLIYYVSVYNIETQKPAGSKGEISKYLHQELKRINYHFKKHFDFYRYYRGGSEYMDDQFFVRGREQSVPAVNEYADIIDPRNCTAHSYLVSRILADDMISGYITGLLDKEKKDKRKDTSGKPAEEIGWAPSKVALVELIYALDAHKAFVPYSVGIKKIADLFSMVFNISLGNIYKTYEEIRLRKKNRTPFLDALSKSLNSRMDSDDEHAL